MGQTASRTLISLSCLCAVSSTRAVLVHPTILQLFVCQSFPFLCWNGHTLPKLQGFISSTKLHGSALANRWNPLCATACRALADKAAQALLLVRSLVTNNINRLANRLDDSSKSKLKEVVSM